MSVLDHWARPVVGPELDTQARHTHFRWPGPLALTACVAPELVCVSGTAPASSASPIIKGAVLLCCPESRELETPLSFLAFLPSQPSSVQASQVPHGAI